MKLKEFIGAPPGTVIKGFENIRIEYLDGIKYNLISPSFEGWPISNITNQSFGYNFRNFKSEEDLILVNRRIQNTEDCLEILLNKNNQEMNFDIIGEDKFSIDVENVEVVKITTEDIPGMLLGDFFTSTGDGNDFMPVADNFFAKLYAKILTGDKIGWISMNLLIEKNSLQDKDYYLEIE